jgi:hypothetical protein
MAEKDKDKGSGGGKPKETTTIDLTHQVQKGANPDGYETKVKGGGKRH